MNRDRTKLKLDREDNTTCKFMEHVTSYERAALRIYITESIEDALRAKYAAPSPAQIILNIVKSGLIHGG